VSLIIDANPEILEKIKNFLIDHTKIEYEITEDKKLLEESGVLWEIAAPTRYHDQNLIINVCEGKDGNLIR